jgi:hypothetical protein
MKQHPRTNLDITDYYLEALRAAPNTLPPLDKIKVTLEPQMTRAFGRAMPLCFKRRNGQVVERDYYAITISEPWHTALKHLVPSEAAVDQLRDTILHELAHISMYYLHPGRSIAHGTMWQAAALNYGANPTPYVWEGNAARSYVDGTDIRWLTIETWKRAHFKAPNA